MQPFADTSTTNYYPPTVKSSEVFFMDPGTIVARAKRSVAERSGSGADAPNERSEFFRGGRWLVPARHFEESPTFRLSLPRGSTDHHIPSREPTRTRQGASAQDNN